MLRTTLIFLVIALVAGVFGFANVVVTAPTIGQVLFCFFLAMLFVTLVVALFRVGRRRSDF